MALYLIFSLVIGIELILKNQNKVKVSHLSCKKPQNVGAFVFLKKLIIMKPIFLELTKVGNVFINVNLNNIIYIEKAEKDNARLVCVGDVTFEVNEAFADVNDEIEKGIEHSPI